MARSRRTPRPGNPGRPGGRRVRLPPWNRRSSGSRIDSGSSGDHISVAGSEGVVSEIDLRYTTLVVDAGTRVLVPNSTLFTNTIRVERREAPPPPGAEVP